MFRNRSGSRLKIVCVDVRVALHAGSFVWPRADAALFSLTLAQFVWLIAGEIGKDCRRAWRIFRAYFEYFFDTVVRRLTACKKPAISGFFIS